jgi:squalene-hopene/tetraprenyl-beta-curcumene cyclase
MDLVTLSGLSQGNRDRLKQTLRRAVAALLSVRYPAGHWCGELQGDSILESEYLLMKFILGQERQPMADGSGPETLEKIARYLRRLQRDDGAWGQYPGSGVDMPATVKAYFALKLMGDDPQAPHMAKARAVVREHGGAERCGSFTNFYLACLGQIPWNAVPAIPPEIVFLPTWSYFHLSKVSAWTRTMILPLSLVATLRPTRRLPRELGIDELFLNERDRRRLTNLTEAPPVWSAFFLGVDRLLKVAEHVGGSPIRRLAIDKAADWIRSRAGHNGATEVAGLGAIFPPMVYIQIALHASGCGRDHPAVQRAERELDALFIEEDSMIRVQPCFSPVWDTGIAVQALADCGLGLGYEPVGQAAQWLVSKQCTHRGDWADNLDGRLDPEAAGWYFEYHNAWYPDIDDTAQVAMTLRRLGGAQNIKAAARGVRWLLAMQNDDGGWAAFDRTNYRRILEYIPFADHNAMQDPSCPDITGRSLECLSWHGYTSEHPAVQKAVGYLKAQQEPEGCWSGRWGVNYLYGTWQAIVGVVRVGEDPGREWIARAGRWLKSVQKEDGSFGESANSYEDPSLKGQGPSTASQTAWAAMALQELYGPDDPDLKRAIDWLAATQLDPQDADDPTLNPDRDPAGSWVEPWFTGTGFPRVFYLRYHLYRLYFPIMALGRYLTANGVWPCDEPAIKMLPKVAVGSDEGQRRRIARELV